MPVAFVLMLGGVLGMLFFLGGPAAFTQIPVIAYKTLDDFVLVAVPLYILMSEILLKGKVGNGLFELGSKWLGHLPGGIDLRYNGGKGLRTAMALEARRKPPAVSARGLK